VVTCALPLRIGGESRNKQVSEFRLALPHQMVSGPAAWSAVSKVSSTRTMFKKQDSLSFPDSQAVGPRKPVHSACSTNRNRTATKTCVVFRMCRSHVGLLSDRRPRILCRLTDTGPFNFTRSMQSFNKRPWLGSLNDRGR